ncbi:MAG: peptidyl-prolyl cis-trans isomerase [Candidatus Moduliflexus flocculans]|nr:peptidyl-prolyl cis-trans isomerase [Candidatus Moduliflexus flocculans]
MLTDEKARALVAERIQRLEKLARKEKSLDVAAQKEGLKPASTGALKKGDPLGDIDSAGAISEALFGLKEKEISAPIFTYAGEALAELKTVEPERPAKFEEVRAEVEKDVARRAEAGPGPGPAPGGHGDPQGRLGRRGVARLSLEYKLVDAHKKEQYLSLVGERPEVDGLVFSLPLKQASEPLAVDEGYAVFRVLERKEATRDEFATVKATERDSLLEQKQNKFLNSYMAKAREEKKVRINYDTFVRLNNDILARYTKTT